jgi:hypothetical protein
MRCCIIHIGLHKTGTTAIQRTLAAKRHELKRAGILCPVDDNQVAFELIESHKLRDADAATKLLETSLVRDDCDYVVLSSEAFSRPSMQTDRLTGFLQRIRAAGWEIVAVVYIRPQPSMLNSMYVQAVKTLREPRAFDEYAEGFHERVLDYAQRLRPWIEQRDIGFMAVPYVPETTGPQITRHMLEAGGVAPEKLAKVDLTALPGINESLGSLAVAAHRWLRLRDPSLDDDHGGRLTRLALAESKRRGWSDDRFLALDAPRARRIREEFAARNEAFAVRHFGRPWDDVFESERERDWKRNEIDIEALAPELQREFNDFSETVLAGVGKMRTAQAAAVERRTARAAAVEKRAARAAAAEEKRTARAAAAEEKRTARAAAGEEKRTERIAAAQAAARRQRQRPRPKPNWFFRLIGRLPQLFRRSR